MVDRVMGRKRQARHRQLAKYVNVVYKNGTPYYSYKHPQMDKARTFASDLKRANACALAVNAHFADAHQDVAMILSKDQPAPHHSLAEVIDLFIRDYIPERDWSAGYTKETKIKLAKLRKLAGKTRFTSLGVKEIRDLLHDSFTGDGVRHARNTLIHVYKYAIGAGLSDRSLTNYAEKVAAPPKKKRQRPRIPGMDEYRDARKKCPDWLQDAMDLAIITLQRRSDIVGLKLTDIVKEPTGQYVRFYTQKTRYALKVPVGDNLRPVLARCRERAMRMGCPYLICTPHRDTHQTSRKEHRGQVLPDYLTRAFKEHTGMHFHELRSLGERMYEQLGYTPEQIRALGGWSDDKMRQLYGETDEIKYVTAEAGLKLDLNSKKIARK